MSLKEELTLDMIPNGLYRTIAEEIGISNFLALSKIVGGSTIYIPKNENLLKPVRDNQIKKEFNGCNHSELALKYNLSESWIRKLCGEGHIKGQFSIFDYMQEQK